MLGGDEALLRADVPGMRACGHQRQHRTRKVVITGLVPVIHVLTCHRKKDVDGRDIGAKQSFVASPGHDGMVRN